jgi:hypothetical protein
MSTLGKRRAMQYIYLLVFTLLLFNREKDK